MSPQLASIVDWDAILDVIWVSSAAGIGVTAVFAIGIVGATRAVDRSRDGHGGESVLFGALAALAGLGVAVAVVFAIVVMTHK